MIGKTFLTISNASNSRRKLVPKNSHFPEQVPVKLPFVPENRQKRERTPQRIYL